MLCPTKHCLQKYLMLVHNLEKNQPAKIRKSNKHALF
jgi:hypothetical protein